MNSVCKLAIAMCIAVLAWSVTGCGGKLDKAAVEKRARESLTTASPEWKDIKYETRANDTVSFVTANRRTVKGKTPMFSFTGGGGSGGVGVNEGGSWRVKYRYEKDKEVAADKMDGDAAELESYRPLAAEFYKACSKACP
jgi:hypothetical protein